jgi:hypothetical protein
MAPAERADVIVDFTGLDVGTELYLISEGPDEPFGGGEPGTDFPVADPETTGQVMKFTAVERTGVDTSRDAADAARVQAAEQAGRQHPPNPLGKTEAGLPGRFRRILMPGT